jgi:hypothetical protein
MALRLRRGYALDSRPRRLLSVEGEHMRIPNDIRKTVVFIGHRPPGSSFDPIGTGFFLMHEQTAYLVTARHLAEELGDSPYHIRLNHEDGGAIDCYCDPLTIAEAGARWFFPDDPAVDVAAMPFIFFIEKAGAQFEFLSTEMAATTAPLIETGDFCYVIGLFGLHPGKRRMMPVVHTGHIAMIHDPREPIPTEDWRDKTNIIDVEGYPVEVANLQGLSGSPVLVRPTMQLQMDYESGKTVKSVVGSNEFYLLGVWQGSWEGQSTFASSFERYRVPVGMGVVTPVEKLLELLNSPPAATQRANWAAKLRTAKPDAVAKG